MNRRHFLSLTAATAALAAMPVFAATDTVQVFKSAGCGCCVGWMKHLERNGFRVASRDLPHGALMQKKLGFGLKPEQSSCHTAEIGGYVVEGHVPAREVKRLLRERPDAVGLSVPDMPVGSPGMEDGDQKEPYDVLLIRRDGSSEVFASYR